MSTVIDEGKNMRLFGAKFIFNKDMQVPESFVSGQVIRKEEVYPMDLDDLLHLLSVVSSVSGGAYLLSEAAEQGGSELTAEDQETLSNLTSSVELLRSVISEKFRRRA
jgi:hypothetical protein